MRAIRRIEKLLTVWIAVGVLALVSIVTFSKSPRLPFELHQNNMLETETSNSGFTCETGKPCDGYTDEVDLRIIVITYNRSVSLKKLLDTLDDLELDGDRAALEIWIDIDKDGKVHPETLQTARSFKWTKGPTRVHVQANHASIAGQWIDTWRPKENSKEHALILEDDLSVSPMAYRFVKAVHTAFANASNYVGVTIQSDYVRVFSPRPKVKGTVSAPKNNTVFMYKSFGTWGFSPKPEHWRRFQDWYHAHKPSVRPFFKPYVPDALTTTWYKTFEKQGTAQYMWSAWFIYYMHIEQLYCVYSNLAVYNGDKKSCLAINRREVGLHFSKKGPENLCKLLRVWRDDFVSIPKQVVRLHWDGSPMSEPF